MTIQPVSNSLPINLEPITPYTNQSIKSAAAVLHEICKKEDIHWYWGLQAAEGFVDEKQSALDHCQRQQRAAARQLREQQRKQTQLLNGRRIDQLNAVERDQVEAIEDAQREYSQELHRTSWKVRDALIELKVAAEQRERIIAEHPQVLTLSHEELQRVYTHEALLNRQANYIAGRVWSAANNLPEAVGVALFDAPVADRQALLEREMRYRTGFNPAEALAHAGHVLAQLTPEQQQAALILAAQQVLGMQDSAQNPQLTKGDIETNAE